MSDYDNTNRGAIWQNRDKQQDNHPDFKGELDVGGRKYWVSAWKRKEGASSKSPALSFSIKPKEDQPRRQKPQDFVNGPAARRPTTRNADMNDDIPFAPEFR